MYKLGAKRDFIDSNEVELTLRVGTCTITVFKGFGGK